MSNYTQKDSATPTRESLAAFVENNPLPMLIFQADGELKSWNQAAQQLAKTQGSMDPASILPAETKAAVTSCAAGGGPSNLTTTWKEHTFSWQFFLMPEAGLVGGLVADTTERAILERQLHETQKSDLVGRFSAGVARDFSNVLTVIQGQVGLMRADPELKPGMEISLRAVSVAAQRACRLLDQLVSFSRNGTARAVRVELNELITQLSSLLGRGLGEDITFQFDYAPALPLLYADPRQIEQIVLNLALNARQSMPQGGLIALQTALAETEAPLTGGPAQTFICLTCTDTGGGTATKAPSDQPFANPDGGTSSRLEFTKRLVKQMGGWLEENRQPLQGSTIKVYFPITSNQPLLAAEVPSGTETILVVEDEPAVRLTIRNILERQGYKVLEAANGVEALAMWHRHHEAIELMVTDMVLPSGLSGEELAEKFHSQKPDLRIIYASGYDKGIAGRGPIPLEGFLFLEKPFEPDHLARLVRQALDQRGESTPLQNV